MRVAIISDIHSNLPAFQAVLDDAGTVDEYWCLGDVVGYGPDPNECVELLRSLPHRCLAGNHDWAALGKLDLYEFNADARAATLWTQEQLSAENMEYLQDLPERLAEGKYTLVHGSPRHPIWEYIVNASVARINFEYFETQVCLIGHTHTPVIFLSSPASGSQAYETLIPNPGHPFSLEEGAQQRFIINPGSIGQPRDGDPRASYAILDTEEDTLEHRRVSYPVEDTQKRMEEYNLPQRLILRLSYGW
ncbi:MAG: metallophosphoesterase family protein [Anaerolineae bacterium]